MNDPITLHLLITLHVLFSGLLLKHGSIYLIKNI